MDKQQDGRLAKRQGIRICPLASSDTNLAGPLVHRYRIDYHRIKASLRNGFKM